jgi:hypothetical protein
MPVISVLKSRRMPQTADPMPNRTTRHEAHSQSTPEADRAASRGLADGGRCLAEPQRAGTRLIAMMASKRLMMMLAAMTVAVAFASGCADAVGAYPAPAKPPTPATASFSARGLAFRYPANWRSDTWSSDLSNFPALIVYLSTSRLKVPCVVRTSPGRIAETCEYPIRILPPGGILVRWNANSLPGWHVSRTNATVAGRKVVETRTSGGWCVTLGGTETITVMIPRTGPGNWYQMDACLRGPRLAQQETEISSMLRSVRIAKNE